MKHMEHHVRQNGTTKINVGGQELNIKIDTTQQPSSVGAMALVGGERIPKNAVSARTQRETQNTGINVSSVTFSDPKKNVKKLGFREGMKVADFGSGSGAYTIALTQVVGVTGTVYAVDIQKDLLTRTQNSAQQQGYENVEVVWGDIETPHGVKLKDELLDGVVLSNTLFQVDDKINTLKEAWRVLKPGGILAVIDWSDSYGGVGPVPEAIVTPAEITVICTDNGFAVQREFDAGEHHYGLLFKKGIGSGTGAKQESEDDFISRTIGQELI